MRLGINISSGSRPNQNAQSWGLARLASAITAGKAAAVDPFARRVDSLKTNYNCNSTFFADSVTVNMPFYK